MQHDLDKAYVSPYDRLLFELYKHLEKTPSELKEILTHRRIAELRDNASSATKKEELWDGF